MYTNILKKNQSLSNIMLPPALTKVIPLKKKKAADIKSILVSRFGDDWETREDFAPFYINLLKCVEEEKKTTDGKKEKAAEETRKGNVEENEEEESGDSDEDEGMNDEEYCNCEEEDCDYL